MAGEGEWSVVPLCCGARHAMRRTLGSGRESLDVEFYFARHFDYRFGMTAVLEQRVFDGLGASDEQAAVEAVLLLGDPFALAIAADEDEGQCGGAARGRFGELHVEVLPEVLGDPRRAHSCNGGKGCIYRINIGRNG